ncbi:MAG: ribbon-helix-helix protein, CopG family [Nitrospirae bacterium]|nr:ribbon-helix-helix protein, CopG family [Nitrospirota bacterium]
MENRQRVVMTISVPPDIARECKEIARAKGETMSKLFREMLLSYKQEKLKDEFYALQRYGARKAKALKFTEKDIEKMIFDNR